MIIRSRSRRRSDFKVFGSPDWPLFPATLLSDGDSVYSRENLFEILGTPEKTCLKVTGSPVKTCSIFGSRNDFQSDLPPLWM